MGSSFWSREIYTCYYERARAKPEGIKLIYRNVDC